MERGACVASSRGLPAMLVCLHGFWQRRGHRSVYGTPVAAVATRAMCFTGAGLNRNLNLKNSTCILLYPFNEKIILAWSKNYQVQKYLSTTLPMDIFFSKGIAVVWSSENDNILI